MKRVYVAGAYSADNVIDVLKNIGRGEEYCANIFHMGFAPFNVWADRAFVTLYWADEFNVEDFYEYGLAWLRVSEIMYVLPDYKNSKGTLKEIEEAKKLGIPIVYNFSDLRKLK